jgi:hypothetical protein
MNPGLYENIPNHEYHAQPEPGSSDIINMSYGFAFWHHKKQNPSGPSQSKMLGSATHTVLQSILSNDPSLIEKEIVVVKGLTTKGKAFEAECAKHPNKYVISPEDFDLARRMVDATLLNAGDYFVGGVCEASLFHTYPDSETTMKCRPDYLRVNEALSINFKTSEDASYTGFSKSCGDWHYDFQSGIYCDLLSDYFKRTFEEVHVVVEKNYDGPIHVGIWTIDKENLDFARAQYSKIIKRIPEMRARGWPSTRYELQVVTLPNYRQRVVDDAIFG